MKTTTLSRPVTLLTLATTVILGTLSTFALQQMLRHPAQFLNGVNQAGDDRGSGRVTIQSVKVTFLLSQSLLAFRGSGRIDENDMPSEKFNVEADFAAAIAYGTAQQSAVFAA